MVPNSLVLGRALLVCAVLAVLPSGTDAHFSHRRDHRQLGLRKREDAEFNPIWAGAIWDEDAGTFNTVTATFTVPDVTGGDGHACAWVGIDGRNCGDGLLQAGIDFNIDNGQIIYDTWYEWWPDLPIGFPDTIDLRAGDVIKVTVTASSTTSGSAVIENLTTKQSSKKELTSSYALCMGSVEWIIEDDGGDAVTPLANFGSLTFEDAIATGPSGKVYNPYGAIIAEMEQNGTVLTSTTTGKNTITVKYI